jgi:hypothetical protein
MWTGSPYRAASTTSGRSTRRARPRAKRAGLTGRERRRTYRTRPARGGNGKRDKLGAYHAKPDNTLDRTLDHSSPAAAQLSPSLAGRGCNPDLSRRDGGEHCGRGRVCSYGRACPGDASGRIVATRTVSSIDAPRSRSDTSPSPGPGRAGCLSGVGVEVERKTRLRVSSTSCNRLLIARQWHSSGSSRLFTH